MFGLMAIGVHTTVTFTSGGEKNIFDQYEYIVVQGGQYTDVGYEVSLWFI